MKDFKIGTDPEFFLKKDGNFVSAIPLIGDEENGTKYNPIKMPCGATIQRDNVAVEIATVPVASADEFVHSIHTAMAGMRAMIPSEYEIAIVPSALFPESELEHPEAMEFGCDPDFNAWTYKQNKIATCFSSNLRTCGAHVHVSHPFLESMDNKIRMIRMMDVYLGLYFTIHDNSEEAIRRRNLYGKAGAYRPTLYPNGDHGVEYRTLSNYWIKNDNNIHLIYGLTSFALHDVIVNYDQELIRILGGPEKIQTVINNGLVNEAKQMMEVSEHE